MRNLYIIDPWRKVKRNKIQIDSNYVSTWYLLDFNNCTNIVVVTYFDTCLKASEMYMTGDRMHLLQIFNLFQY